MLPSGAAVDGRIAVGVGTKIQIDRATFSAGKFAFDILFHQRIPKISP
jgi:hypothetical protein